MFLKDFILRFCGISFYGFEKSYIQLVASAQNS